MRGKQARYWLIEHGRLVPEADEMSTEDFTLKDYVCCEAPAGEGFDWALEVFTSWGGAAAEARGIESLGRKKHLTVADAHRGLTRGETHDATSSGELVGLSGLEVFEVLESSGVPYVLLDPPPVDKPITGRLHIESASAFANQLKRRLIASLRED